jgi:hypothetical protein
MIQHSGAKVANGISVSPFHQGRACLRRQDSPSLQGIDIDLGYVSLQAAEFIQIGQHSA